jgi:hypothetical protein
MPIPFKDGVNFSKLKQNPYSLSKRDQDAIDTILDPLVTQGRVVKVLLGQPSPVAAPSFLVWKGTKPRVVTDMR